jgi:leucine dehydrogenase
MLTASTQVLLHPETHEIFKMFGQSGHENLIYCYDKETGLKAIIGIHNTVLGPALGGTRFFNYANEYEAVYDVVRLSRGMTYKAAISGINLGGGKAVIIGDPEKLKSEAFWRRYGRFVHSLNGKYITAEDVNTNSRDMEYISLETPFVAGKPEYLGGGGDPSPVTAYGTYLGLKASVKEVYGNDTLDGKKILVEGVGAVGSYLVERLVKENATIFITDVNEKKIKKLTAQFPQVTAAARETSYDLDIDIYAPCAMGGSLNTDTISRLKCHIVAGAANNQLEEETLHGNMLKSKGILYAPDFLINAGGVINCYQEVVGYNREQAFSRTELIYERTLEIFQKAKKENITTHVAAQKIAEERIYTIAQIKTRR